MGPYDEDLRLVRALISHCPRVSHERPSESQLLVHVTIWKGTSKSCASFLLALVRSWLEPAYLLAYMVPVSITVPELHLAFA